MQVRNVIKRTYLLETFIINYFISKMKLFNKSQVTDVHMCTWSGFKQPWLLKFQVHIFGKSALIYFSKAIVCTQVSASSIIMHYYNSASANDRNRIICLSHATQPTDVLPPPNWTTSPTAVLPLPDWTTPSIPTSCHRQTEPRHLYRRLATARLNHATYTDVLPLSDWTTPPTDVLPPRDWVTQPNLPTASL